jgi:hypothetical protein
MLHRPVLPMALLLLIVWDISVFAQQFSADLVHVKPENAVPAKVFVRGDKIRFETVGVKQRAIVVVDLKEQSGFMALPENKTYSVLRPAQILPVMPFFHPADPENACPAWETLVHKKGICTKIGDETINGRPAVKYKGVSRGGDTGMAWVDRALNFVVKWEGQASSSELQSIKEAPLAAGMFEIPKEYERINQDSSQQSAAKKKPSQIQSAPQMPRK